MLFAHNVAPVRVAQIINVVTQDLGADGSVKFDDPPFEPTTDIFKGTKL